MEFQSGLSSLIKLATQQTATLIPETECIARRARIRKFNFRRKSLSTTVYSVYTFVRHNSGEKFGKRVTIPSARFTERERERESLSSTTLATVINNPVKIRSPWVPRINWQLTSSAGTDFMKSRFDYTEVCGGNVGDWTSPFLTAENWKFT